MDDDIKSNFDRLIEQFNDDVTHSAPKKLNFETLNDSWSDTCTVFAKKRRLESVAGDSMALNDSKNLSSSMLDISGNTAPQSPWEMRRLKADYIEAQSRIVQLKAEIERIQKLHKESDFILHNQVEELKKQCDYSCKKVLDLERHMDALRKREKSARNEVFSLRNQLKKQQEEHEDEIEQLANDKFENEQEAKRTQYELHNELSECKRQTERVQMELDLKTDELDKLNTLLQEYKARVANYDEVKNELEKQTQELDVVISQLKQREDEISNYNDWKEITKNSHLRLSHVAERDAELQRLREKNRQLHELLGNKLLLEEQVHDYKARLDKEEGARAEAAALQVKLTHCEQELKEWVQVAQDHCLANILVSPMALRARIEELLKSSIIMTAEKNSSCSEAKSLESQLQEYKQKCEIYAKNIEELNMALKRHKAFKERVQKKLLVVSKERDFYKQLLENYERDVTVSNITTSEANNTEAHLRMRVDMLEKTLLGYKEMCANLEKEVNARTFHDNEQQLSEQTVCAEAYESLKKDLYALRLEHERLNRRKNELELELENRCLKQENDLKILRFANSPAEEAYKNAENFVEKLQAEIERLKRHIKKMENDNELTQARANDETTNMTINIKELNQLRAELETTNNKMKKLKDAYKQANMELRDVCYMLLGYKIDHAATGHYKLSSMYAEGPDDYLLFHLNEGNTLDMLETPYSVTLQPFIEKELGTHKSLPVFLSAHTMDLYQRSTVTIS